MLQTGVNLDLPTVQLLHALPDDSRHVDWMIARDESPDAPLVTFRLPESLQRLSEGQSMPAEHIGDHRRAYLQYEGPVSGGRGAVKRLIAGRIAACAGDNEQLFLHVLWGQDNQYLSLHQQNSRKWLVKSVTRAAVFGKIEQRTS